MGEQHVSDTGSVSQHKSITFIILFDESNPEGLEVTKQSIECQKAINANIISCPVQQLQQAKASVTDSSTVIILRSGDTFYSENSCIELASEISEEVECVYCDSIIRDAEDEMLQLMFPFSLETMSSGYMITNIILSSKLFDSLTINENINFLLGHDLILKACQLTKVRHLAEAKFILPSRAVNVEHEIPFVGTIS